MGGLGQDVENGLSWVRASRQSGLADAQGVLPVLSKEYEE